jgi:DNA-binding NtrC family response regulator
MSRILVVDDEDAVRTLMLEILERAGHEVVGAATAAEALARLEDNRIELVVSDLVMPGLSGVELLELLHERHPELPVVIVTGAGTPTNLGAARLYGATIVVEKPFTHAELCEAAAVALAPARRA